MIEPKWIRAVRRTEPVPAHRVRAIRRALISSAKSAFDASVQPDIDEMFAASLRGKGRGYQEAVAMIETILTDGYIRRPKRARK